MNYRPTLLNMSRYMQEGLVNLVNTGRYDKKQTFTLVLQPILNDQVPPLMVWMWFLIIFMFIV